MPSQSHHRLMFARPIQGVQNHFQRATESGETCEAIAREREGVLVEFVTNDAGGTVVAVAGGDVFLLHATQGKCESVNVRNVMRRTQARAQGFAKEIGKRIVVQEAISVTEEVRQHLGPAIPEDKANESENRREDQKNPGFADGETDPKERNEEGVPAQSGQQTPEHGVEGGESDAFLAPVKVAEPWLAWALSQGAKVLRFARNAEEAVNQEKEATEEEHGADDSDHPIRSMFAPRDEAEGGEANPQAGRKEGNTEQCGAPAVNRGGALSGMVF